MTEGSDKCLNIETETWKGTVQLVKEEQCLGSLDYQNGYYYLGLGRVQDKIIIKEGFGYYHYSDGSLYVGQWQKEHKHGKGILFYHNGDIYYGDWENNYRKGTGIYFWTKTDATNKTKYYQASIGCFNMNRIIKGIMHYNNPQLNEAKHESNQYLFIGEFNYQGEKDDKNGILYDFKRKFFFIGNFVKDCIKDIGYEVFIDDSKDIVDKMITVRLREEEKSEGHIEEIWQFPIDIKSIESDKPILEKNAIDEYESKLNKLFIDLIANDTIIRQFEKLYEMIIQYKRDIDIDTELNIEEIHQLNKGIQDIYMEYPDLNSFLPAYVDSTHIEQHIFNENKQDGNKEDGDHANKEEEVKENENNTSQNTETGMTINID